MADDADPAAIARDEQEFVRLWLARLDDRLGTDDWKAWLKEAEDCENRYSSEKGAKDKRFNIFYANVETITAAVYNSDPTPDVRRRFGDADPPGKMAADVIERAISGSCDLYDFGECMDGVVHDGEVVGSGMARVRFETKFAQPEMGHNGGPSMGDDQDEGPQADGGADEGQPIAWQTVWAETVDWRDVVWGSASAWAEVPFLAFKHMMDRDAIAGLNPKVAELIELSGYEGDEKRAKGRKPTDPLMEKAKRGEVWEIWNRGDRTVIYVARDWPSGALAVKPDPLGLREFWPMPRPHQPIRKPHDLTPVPPFRIYADQAKELSTISVRIAKLTAAARWRGVYDSAFASAFKEMEGLEDGSLAPLKDAMMWKDKGLDAAIWLMPLDKLVATLKQLHEDREQVKQTIYELIGVADIMRGASQASETLGAQQLKTQWGSLRVSRRQKAVQRYARDLFRLKAEILGKKFAPHVLSMMTGIDLQPTDPEQQQIVMAAFQLMRGDMEREYRIDIETDSTVQADVQQAQTNAGLFIQGIGGFFQAMGPAVQAGMVQVDEAADILMSLARPFKLGRQAEDAIERIGKRASEAAKQPQQQQPDPAMEQAKADMEAKKAELQLKAADMQGRAQLDQQKFGFEQQKHAETMAMEREKMQADMVLKERTAAMDHEFKREQMMSGEMMKREDMQSRERQHESMKQHAGDVADFAHGRTAKDAGALVQQMAPALQAVGEGLAQLGADMRTGMEAQAQATEQQAQATAALAAAASAETELVRDPQTGRAVGARKRIQPQVN